MSNKLNGFAAPSFAAALHSRLSAFPRMAAEGGSGAEKPSSPVTALHHGMVVPPQPAQRLAPRQPLTAPLPAPLSGPLPAPAAIASAAGQRAPRLSDSSVGREIRALRRSQGRTQKEVARVVGVTGAQLHRYEAGTTRIAASRLIAIAEALGVAAETLIAAGYAQAAAAGPALPVATAAPVEASDDIVELIELYAAITDVRHRNALLAVARMMAGPYRRERDPAEG